MHSRRLGVGVAVVNRLLYAIGGFDGKDRLASMECYHPENNAWTLLPSMNVGRSGAGVAALNQFIYVVGGFDGTRQLSTVERYDTEHQIWDTVQSIKIARSALSLTVLDGKLYAMGGFDGHTFLAIVEVYDPELDKWEEGTPLSTGRSGHASAVIYQPSCVSTYMDCIEDQMNSDKRPPCPPGDDGSSRAIGPPNSGASTSNPTNSMQPFSGSRCNHCNDGSRNSDTGHDHLILPDDAIMDVADESIGYFPNAVQPLDNLQLDFSAGFSDMKPDNPPEPDISSGFASVKEPIQLPIEITNETNSWDEHTEDNPKKCRRKCFSRCRTFRRTKSENGSDAIVDSSSSSPKPNSVRHPCAFSKLKKTFKQNLNGLVAWSSSTSNVAAGDSSTTTAGERKSCKFRNYYKCKMK